MLEDGVKFFRIPILFPRLHAKYSKQFLYHNHKKIPQKTDQIQRLFTNSH